MAEKKISALTAAGALTGAELIELVQSAASVQSSVTAIKNFVVAAIQVGAPAALDTLDELAAALADDANFAATMTTALAGKQPLDADLTAIAALTTTAYGRAFLALADAAAGLTALGIPGANTAWTAWSPTLTYSAGKFAPGTAGGALAASPLYKVIGKVGELRGNFTVTTIGTMTGSVNLSMPAGVTVTGIGVGAGVNRSSSKGVFGRVGYLDASTISFVFSGGAIPADASGEIVDFTIPFEAA